MRPFAIALVALVLSGSAEAGGKLAHKNHVHKTEVVETVVQGPVAEIKPAPAVAVRPAGTMLTGVDAGRAVVVAPKPGVYAVPMELRTAVAAPLVTSPVIAASAVVAPVVAAVPTVSPLITNVPAVPVTLSQFVTGVPAAFVR